MKLLAGGAAVPEKTIGHHVAKGIRDAIVLCRDCGKLSRIPFATLELPDATVYGKILRVRKLQCSGCGSRDLELRPPDVGR